MGLTASADGSLGVHCVPYGHFIRRLSLTHRLAALTLVASLPGLIALVYSAIDLRNSKYAEVRAEALRGTQFVVSEIDQIFDGIKGVLSAVSQASEVRLSDPGVCSDYLWRVHSRLPSLTSIVIVNPDGKIRCFGGAAIATPNLGDRDYLRDAISTRKFVVGTYLKSRLSSRNIIPIALPILNGDVVDGVVLAGLNLEWLGQQLRDRGLPRGGSLAVVDRNGIVVAREPYPERYIGNPVSDQGRELFSQTTTGVREYVNVDGVLRITGYVPWRETPFGLYVATGISQQEAFAPIERAVRASILLFALGSLVAIVLAWLVGDGIIRRPLMRMVAAAEAWRRGQEQRAGVARSDEFGFLDQTFDHLMEENAARQEERDTAEARREILVHELAHRVKNTLATVQSIASMSFRQSQGPEALRGFQDRLQALVRGHDLLTQKDWRHADLSEVVKAAVAPVNAAHGHRIMFSGAPVDLPPATAVPMAMILHELCTNALKYGALSNADGTVTIRWTASPHERGVAISLIWSEEKGPPVTPPGQEGFGSRLISSLTQQMHGSFEARYPPSGLVCNIKLVSPKYEPRD